MPETLDGTPSRAEIATRLLCMMVTTRGSKRDKVAAAVEYADLLLSELETKCPQRTERTPSAGR